MKTVQKITKTALALSTVLCVANASAQEAETFTPSGKPVVTIFSNVHTGIKSAGDESGFGLERCYLGYEYQFTKELKAKAVYDMGTSKVAGSDLERIGYVKNAFVQYSKGNFTTSFGLIGMELFNVQEKFWGNRYLKKSFLDEYKYGSSADMGITGKYSFGKMASVDATISNGEGYKKLNVDDCFRYGLGLTFNPVKMLTLRAYADRYDCPQIDTLDLKAQSTLALFAGIKTDILAFGCEYNYMWNSKFANNSDLFGFSAYTNVTISDKWQGILRYDNANKSVDGTSDNVEQVFLVGAQFAPAKELKLTPNVVYTKKKDADGLVGMAINMSFSL